MSSTRNIPVKALHCVKCDTDLFRYQIETSMYSNRCTICYELMVPLTPQNCMRDKNNNVTLHHKKYFQHVLKVDF